MSLDAVRALNCELLLKPVKPAALRALLESAPPRRALPEHALILPPTPEELGEALDQQRIVTVFQPKVTLSDGQVVGVEALARWRHPPRGPVPPDIFIPLAEQCGLIVPLTRCVLNDALTACQRWRRHHPACSVAVNMSPLVLANPALPEEIEAMLLRCGLFPAALTVEVTETTFITNPLLATELLTRLRIKGIGLSMDDFGTGYSSLLTLLRLPFSELKIDRSFVTACETDPEAWKIVRATISLALIDHTNRTLNTDPPGVPTSHVTKGTGTLNFTSTVTLPGSGSTVNMPNLPGWPATSFAA